MRRTLTILLLLALTACSRYDFTGFLWMSSPSVEDRFAASMEYNKANGPFTVAVPTENYRLYVVTDVHVWKSTANLDKFAAILKADATAAPFWLSLGDIVDGQGNMPVFAEHASGTGKTMFNTMGNHDLYYSGWKDWQPLFHTSAYTVDAVLPSGARDLFIALDSGNASLGRSQRAWLEETLAAAQGKYRHITVFTHTHFFRKDASQGTTSNYAMEETMDLTALFARYGVSQVLTGHDHTQERSLYKGVPYAVLGALKVGEPHPGYTVCTYGDSVSLEFVPLS